ncbi:hypothetical protein ACQ86N_23085 [Puia sp. P3]|uniref:hypothetical protein n=1 Tax=Puia sp. P3 TaxID=3423952 RepID=UPI003D66FCB5
MKKIPKYLENSVWNKDIISDPYQTIAEFFSAASLIDYRKDIRKIVRYAFSERAWEKDNPADILYRFNQLEKILNAAYLVNKEEKDSPLEISQSDVFNPNLFCGWIKGHSEWEYLPRMLSFKEYKNPYLALKRIFEFKKLFYWKDLLKMFSEFVFTNQSIEFESLESYRCIDVYVHLTKLVEAVHLIDVREVNHIGGNIKNRIPIRKF